MSKSIPKQQQHDDDNNNQQQKEVLYSLSSSSSSDMLTKERNSAEINVVSQSERSNKESFPLESIANGFISAAIKQMEDNSKFSKHFREIVLKTMKSRLNESSKKDICFSIYSIPTAINNAAKNFISFVKYQLWQEVTSKTSFQTSEICDTYNDNVDYDLKCKNIKQRVGTQLTIDAKRVKSIACKINTTLHDIVAAIFNDWYEEVLETSITPFIRSGVSKAKTLEQLLHNKEHQLQYFCNMEKEQWISFIILKVSSSLVL